jgi:selenocysteine-specific elongation factor
MQVRHYILATAGHVDHGKSALVKALTGIDPDRLPEEKARGITIDLGFAHLDLPGPGPCPATLRLGIVDVPGHEDFVKNMAAGVGAADAALLAVAADDGWMPQTEEHLQILAYLGVNRAVIALTKSDLAPGQEHKLASLVRERLRGSPFAEAAIVPVSATSGQGLDRFRETLLQVLTDTPAPRDFGKPRLPVDRVFTLRGIGTVVTGTLIGGVLRRGQTVVIQPSGHSTRLRALQNYGHDVETSVPGARTAINLPEVAASGATAEAAVRRGDVITLPEFGSATDTLSALLEKSPRLLGSKEPAAKPLKDGALARVHWGSANAPARVLLLNGGELTPGGKAIAQLRFEQPVFCFAGDRFIVRDWAERVTLAGGVVLETEASRRHWRVEKQSVFLAARARAPEEVSVMAASQLAKDGAVGRSALLLKSRFSHAEIAEAVTRLVAEGKAAEVGEFVVETQWWAALRQQAAGLIDEAHRRQPQLAGLSLHELRGALAARLPWPGVFEALVGELCRAEFRQVGAAIQRAAHRLALPPHLQAAAARLRAVLQGRMFDPPSRKQLAPDSLSQQALRFLLETAEAVELSPEVVLSAEAYHRVIELIKDYLRRHGAATVSDLRQAVGSSRRIMVPLLEKLDREGVTQRQGDQRILGTNT